jgi:hypothetical protein
MKPIKVGLLGIGTVGGGTFNVLKRNQEEIRRRAGRGIEIAMVADRNTERARRAPVARWRSSTTRRRGQRPDIDIVVELIGGYGIAKRPGAQGDRQRQARGHRQQGAAGRAWQRDLRRRRKKGVMVAFEAAVAGGIPIIKALREGLTANRIQWIAGIINGTTNFILSEMRDKGLDFATVLKEAQRLGYAEADPTFDIEGVDAAHKATIMSAIAFGIPVQFDKATWKASPSCRPPTSSTPSNWATASSCWASPSRRQRHRAARAPDADAGQAPDRQRGRRDERRAGAGRRRGRHAVLRQGRRRRADRLGRDRRPGRHHPPATADPNTACRTWPSSPTP